MFIHILTHSELFLLKIITILLAIFPASVTVHLSMLFKNATFKASKYLITLIFIFSLSISVSKFYFLKFYNINYIICFLSIMLGSLIYFLSYLLNIILFKFFIIHKDTKPKPVQYIFRGIYSSSYSVNFILYIFIALFEELLFRAFLFSIIIELKSFYYHNFLIMGTLMLFALNHINFGWHNVVSKFLMAVVAIFFIIYFNSLIGAILVHITFNIIAIYKINKIVIKNKRLDYGII